MADVNRGNRPLSPHLQVYRPQLTSITSILTRITGNALLLAALLSVWWLLGAASGPECPIQHFQAKGRKRQAAILLLAINSAQKEYLFTISAQLVRIVQHLFLNHRVGSIE